MGARLSLLAGVGTVAEFVQLCKRAGPSIGVEGRGYCVHPRSLDRVMHLPNFGALPLSVLAAAYLAARDIAALARGLKVCNTDGDELLPSDEDDRAQLRAAGIVDLPRKLLKADSEGRFSALHVVARLLARCIYLSPKPPSAVYLPQPSEEDGELKLGTSLCQMAGWMDFLGEIGEHKLSELLPDSLRHWDGEESHGQTIAAFSALRVAWSEKIGDPYRIPTVEMRNHARATDDGDNSGLIQPVQMGRRQARTWGPKFSRPSTSVEDQPRNACRF